MKPGVASRFIELHGGPSDGQQFIAAFAPTESFAAKHGPNAYEAINAMYVSVERGFARYEYDENAGERGKRLVYRFDRIVDEPLESDGERLA